MIYVGVPSLCLRSVLRDSWLAVPFNFFYRWIGRSNTRSTNLFTHCLKLESIWFIIGHVQGEVWRQQSISRTSPTFYWVGPGWPDPFIAGLWLVRPARAGHTTAPVDISGERGWPWPSDRRVAWLAGEWSSSPAFLLRWRVVFVEACWRR